MTSPVSAAAKALKVDIAGAAFKADPFPTLRRMRAAGPLVRVKLPLIGRVWMTTTHEAALALLKDQALFVQEGRNAGKAGVAGMQWWMPRSLRLLANNMLLKDEPDHRRLRKLVDQAFQRRDVLAMRGAVEARADRLLEGLPGETDLVDAFARRLPLEVICDLLGLPDEDRQAFSAWTRAMTGITGAFGLLRATPSINRMTAYVRELIARSRLHPRPGLIAELVRAEEDGDRLDETELISMIFLLLVAGFETTTHLISTSVVALEQNPAQKKWLLTDPQGRMERAVEELARFTTPVQTTKPRYVARDTDFFGQPLKRGEIAMAFLAAANADPAVFDKPERLALDRFPNPHVVFGSGIHFCLGMQLARVEAQSALARLYARYPDFELALPPDGLDWTVRLGIRGLETLPVRLRRHGARKAA